MQPTVLLSYWSLGLAIAYPSVIFTFVRAVGCTYLRIWNRVCDSKVQYIRPGQQCTYLFVVFHAKKEMMLHLSTRAHDWNDLIGGEKTKLNE